MASRTIAFLVSQLSWTGGTGRVTCAVANELIKTGNRVVIISLYGDSQQKAPFPLDPKVKVVGLDTQYDRLRKQFTENFFKINKILVNYRVDWCVWVGNYQGLIGLPAVWLGRFNPFRKTRFAFHDHGALMNQWDAKPVRLMRWLCAIFCHKVVTLTERSRNDYISKFKLPQKRVVSIANWIPEDALNGEKHYRSDSKTLVWAGRMTDEKGALRIPEIASKILPTRPDWKWLVAGDGEEYEDLNEELTTRGLKNVELLGTVSDMNSLYSQSAIATMTSDREGLPMFLLEAKAHLLPAVSFDVLTGPSDIIRDGVDGYLVEPYDCDEFARRLGELMDSKELRESFSKACGEDIERFGKKSIMDKWNKLFGITE